MSKVRHLYVHVPFCAHRCGYCDFVTVTGHDDQHAPYVDAVLAELAASDHLDPAGIDTVFVGGGTPTLLGPALLGRLLDGLPAAAERTVECNPETVTPELARALADRGLRVSLGAQSFQAPLLAVLERRATPAVVEAARDDAARGRRRRTSRSISSTASPARTARCSTPTSTA